MPVFVTNLYVASPLQKQQQHYFGIGQVSTTVTAIRKDTRVR